MQSEHIVVPVVPLSDGDNITIPMSPLPDEGDTDPNYVSNAAVHAMRAEWEAHERAARVARDTGTEPPAPPTSLYRRYLAGLRSLLDRADPDVRVEAFPRVVYAPGPYRDYDIVIPVCLGNRDYDAIPDGERACSAQIDVALHRTGGDDIRLAVQALHPDEDAGHRLLHVRGSDGVVTVFELEEDHALLLAQRVVLRLAFAVLYDLVQPVPGGTPLLSWPDNEAGAPW